MKRGSSSRRPRHKDQIEHDAIAGEQIAPSPWTLTMPLPREWQRLQQQLGFGAGSWVAQNKVAGECSKMSAF